MIKIIKPGQKEFHGFCKRCGCEFIYEISDLKLSATSDKVSCPICGQDYYHPSMVQDPTIPGGIAYQWPSDSTDPCAGCVWRSNLEHGGVYIGDTPCTWCDKNKFKNITCEQPSIKGHTNREDITQGTVMSTIYNACCEGYPDDHAVGKGLVGGHIVGNSNACCGSSCRNSDSVESHDDAKKRCRGKH